MKKYAIVNTEYLDQIDFSQVLQDRETVRYNLAGNKFIVKWEGLVPMTLSELPSYDGPYTNSEILLIGSSPEWKSETF